MVNRFRQAFGLNRNVTLANYRFRSLRQGPEEDFDKFVIRVKQEVKNCSFNCTSPTCTASQTMIRDQILIGTTDDSLREKALAEQMDLNNVVDNGRMLEAAHRGATKLKIKQEPGVSGVNRTKPGKYSKKGRQQKDFKGAEKESKCKACSSFRCTDRRKCPARKATCFTCGKTGHFSNAAYCKGPEKPKKSKKKARKVSEDSEASTSSSSPSSQEDTDTEEDKAEKKPDKKEGKSRRIYSAISSIRKVAGRRVPRARQTQNRYQLRVIINERIAPVYCDTGADISICSYKTAKKLKLNLQDTKMRIRPYGSRAMDCKAEYTGTIRHKDNSVNATIYVLKQKVETLLSGPVCEALGIIQFNGPAIRAVQQEPQSDEHSPEKVSLISKFPTIFKGLGKLKNHQVKLYINDSIRPVAEPARQVPYHLIKKRNEALDKLQQEGVIEEHVGPADWVSNIVLTPKDNNETRVTLDMRQVNKAIQSTKLPIPRPEQVSSQLAGYKVFSKLDFKSAFYQLELDEESRHLTVFHGNGKLMRFRRLIMGASPASGELSKALSPLFKDIKHAYLIQDDLIVAGNTQEQHDKALHKVCKAIEKSGMTLNAEKCIISKAEVPWWGLVISSRGISPDPKKVEAVKQMTPPSNKEEVTSLICMLQSSGYTKDFVIGLAEKTKHMRKLLKKNAKFKWNSQCDKEFNLLKEEFYKDILMRHYDPSLETFIEVDASRHGLSAILMQGEDRHIVAVASRSTTPVESKYAQLDLEALAVDYGLSRFRFYTLGADKVKILTDHKPLIPIFRNTRAGSVRSSRIKLRH